MHRLEWSDGKLAAMAGRDLASVARTLCNDDLAFWVDRLRKCACSREAGILEAEAERRAEAFLAGPLFR
jgi:hypothetical protein